jgi:hypothetical protein
VLVIAMQQIPNLSLHPLRVPFIRDATFSSRLDDLMISASLYVQARHVFHGR